MAVTVLDLSFCVFGFCGAFAFADFAVLWLLVCLPFPVCF